MYKSLIDYQIYSFYWIKKAHYLFQSVLLIIAELNILIQISYFTNFNSSYLYPLKILV